VLSFRWGAFGIEGMVEEKIISTSFGGAAGHGERAPGASATQPLCGQTKRHMAHELPYPCVEQTRAPPDTWAAPVRGAEPAPPGAWVLAKGSIGYGSPSATWRLGKLDALFML